MISVRAICVFLAIVTVGLADDVADYRKGESVYDFTVKDIQGNSVPLSKYKGHVLLIVNVASNCGLTEKNYEQLNQLYEKYGESQGLRILAFPSDQFNHQEPGTNEEIAEFAKKHNVKFDMFSKIEVNGENADPFYKYLKYKQPGNVENDDSIEWNFAKFIVDKDGQVVERHIPKKDPLDLIPSLEKYF
ncbi:probable phospholipid hydroperoxide glutathione peroxidase [Sitophilus oryzae]|uniref:Glutathione peroxidase n=1 Tax=Sitophilus oryzae TaxID=7048 RepID=A0A6J2X4D4_SITOR|nr:probable phospholipid hydroperoxide glutathione peroxidase [Sitophilus oryzae]XP_030745802.1 probable phospholipid hydroperoxide glutathione peroxidase [Sitophilus oryzae]XP_030745804.1 probable phospholipid hydroperoxide glutathione peroxidase [Sitophilus oryzae]